MSDTLKIVSVGEFLIVGTEKKSDLETSKADAMKMRTIIPVSANVPPNLANIIPNAAELYGTNALESQTSNPVQDVPCTMIPYLLLTRPKIIVFNPDNNSMRVKSLIGGPEKIIIPKANIHFFYDNSDPEFEKFYLAETASIPGLHLIK